MMEFVPSRTHEEDVGYKSLTDADISLLIENKEGL